MRLTKEVKEKNTDGHCWFKVCKLRLIPRQTWRTGLHRCLFMEDVKLNDQKNISVWLKSLLLLLHTDVCVQQYRFGDISHCMVKSGSYTAFLIYSKHFIQQLSLTHRFIRASFLHLSHSNWSDWWFIWPSILWHPGMKPPTCLVADLLLSHSHHVVVLSTWEVICSLHLLMLSLDNPQLNIRMYMDGV